MPRRPCLRDCTFPLTCPSCWGRCQGPQSQLENQTFCSFVRHLCTFGHHLENRAMHLPKRHLSTAVMCAVNRGVIGGMLTDKESAGLGQAVLRGFGEKSWGKKRCPHVDPHFTSRSCLLHWRLGALHSPSQTQKSHMRFGSGVLHSATSSPAAKAARTRKSKSSLLSRGELKSPTHTWQGGKLEINKGNIPTLDASCPYLLPSPAYPCLLSA